MFHYICITNKKPTKSSGGLASIMPEIAASLVMNPRGSRNNACSSQRPELAYYYLADKVFGCVIGQFIEVHVVPRGKSAAGLFELNIACRQQFNLESLF